MRHARNKRIVEKENLTHTAADQTSVDPHNDSGCCGAGLNTVRPTDARHTIQGS
jgi:hypothetical protein